MNANIKAALKHPLIRVVGSVLILFMLFLFLPVAQLWAIVTGISPYLWAFTVAIFLVGHGLGAFKWRILITLNQSKIPLLTAFKCYFAGLFANLCLPSLVGGDIVRAGLAIRYNKETEGTILGGLFDRLIDVFALCILILIGGWFSPHLVSEGDQKILWLFFIIFILLGFLAITLLLIKIPHWLPTKLKTSLERTKKPLDYIIKHPERAFVVLGISLLIQTGFVGLNALLGAQCNIQIPFTAWLLVWPLAKLSALLPISMGGIGVREVALGVLLGRLDITFTNAVALGLLWESVLITGGLIGGAIYLLLGREISQLKAVLASTSSEK